MRVTAFGDFVPNEGNTANDEVSMQDELVAARDDSTGFRFLLVLSLILALLVFGNAAVVGNLYDTLSGLRASYGVSEAWFVVLLAGLVRYRRRGLWLLLGAPLALGVPGYINYSFAVMCNGTGCI